ncbi:RICIN domain-containing protein [Pseudoalteromonas sp. MT33b]|uniref:RICIN domain-containing protein n=1 Tax=Pseudoalteromonas sp. MT33b TaxID=2759705 RepID=UPI0015FE03F2|nr:RICIN domain-containing protein [Pseudoalteromonas sp. MT33b]QMW13672.1 RICIN domain-containing protein [Pseudoalteromonas sp. MT33b]
MYKVTQKSKKTSLLQWGFALLGALSCYSVQAEDCNAMPESGQLYSVINRGSGLALDINTTDSGAAPNVITYDYWGGNNQKFQFIKESDGYWIIRSKYNNKVLDVLDSSQSNGANVIVYDDWQGANQRWQLKASSSGGFNITNKLTNKSLTVAGSSNAANVYQNDDAGVSSQRWFINPVDATCGSSSGGGSQPTPSNLVGFAAQPGQDGLSTTTGGGNATPITVTSCNALNTALSSTSPAVIHIPDNTTINCQTSNRTVQACPLDCGQWNDYGKTWYRVPVGNQSCSELGSSSNSPVNVTRNERRIIVQSNKTLQGLGKNSKIVGASLVISKQRNIIIKNVMLENINPALVEAGDGISIDDSSHVWIDHMAFNKISDGYIDIDNSQNITLSWNRFYGYNTQVCANQHWYTHLFRNSQVTAHHNFWDTAAGRNPKIDGYNSRVHMFNNYWKNITYFAISASDGAEVLVENNYFENSAKPHWNQGSGYFSASGNIYTGRSATDQYRDSGATVFSDVQLYPYRLDSANTLGSQVDGGTGPQ